MQTGQCAVGRDVENDAEVAGTAVVGRSIKRSVAALHQRRFGICSIRATGKGIQTGKGAIGAIGRNLEHGAGAVGAAVVGRSIKTPIAALHQPRPWISAIHAVGELIQDSRGAVGGYLKDRAVASVGAAGGGRSVEIAVAALHHGGLRVGSVREDRE